MNLMKLRRWTTILPAAAAGTLSLLLLYLWLSSYTQRYRWRATVDGGQFLVLATEEVGGQQYVINASDEAPGGEARWMWHDLNRRGTFARHFAAVGFAARSGWADPDPRSFGLRQPFYFWLVRVPMWPFVAASLGLFAILAFGAWRRRGRSGKGQCQACGYDLTGNTTGVCSECGAALGSKGPSPLAA